jgi:hypothetical protein
MALKTINQTLTKTQLFRGVVFNSGETSPNLLCPLDLSEIATMTACVGTLWSAEVLLSFVHAIIEIKCFCSTKKHYKKMAKRMLLQCINGMSSNPVEGRTKI